MLNPRYSGRRSRFLGGHARLVATLSTVIAACSVVAAVPLSAAEATPPVAASTTHSDSTLHDALKNNNVREIVFAQRKFHPEGHWYANIGYYANNPENKLLCAEQSKALLVR